MIFFPPNLYIIYSIFKLLKFNENFNNIYFVISPFQTKIPYLLDEISSVDLLKTRSSTIFKNKFFTLNRM